MRINRSCGRIFRRENPLHGRCRHHFPAADQTIFDAAWHFPVESFFCARKSRGRAANQ